MFNGLIIHQMLVKALSKLKDAQMFFEQLQFPLWPEIKQIILYWVSSRPSQPQILDKLFSAVSKISHVHIDIIIVTYNWKIEHSGFIYLNKK